MDGFNRRKSCSFSIPQSSSGQSFLRQQRPRSLSETSSVNARAGCRLPRNADLHARGGVCHRRSRQGRASLATSGGGRPGGRLGLTILPACLGLRPAFQHGDSAWLGASASRIPAAWVFAFGCRTRLSHWSRTNGARWLCPARPVSRAVLRVDRVCRKRIRQMKVNSPVWATPLPPPLIAKVHRAQVFGQITGGAGGSPHRRGRLRCPPVPRAGR